MHRIDRQTFLLRSGAVFGAPLFLQYCGAPPGRLAGTGGDDPLENARAAGFTAPVLQAMNAGITAPNPHNTQAWKFLVHDELSFDLFADETRLLPATDPPARQIHLGQGTFLEHTVIGAAELGYRAEVRLFPEGYGAQAIGKQPVARVRLIRDETRRPDPLYAAIPFRNTNRTEYSGPMLTDAEYARLRGLVRPQGSTMVFINDPERLRACGDLFYRGLAVELSGARFEAETVRWMRYGDDEIYGTRDGISLPGNGITGLKRRVVETFFDKTLNDTAREQALAGIRAGIDSAKGLVYLKTAKNGFEDWVKAGRDYARLQLGLTELGLTMQPYSSILQEAPEFAPLQAELTRLLGLAAGEKIQMIVRVGRSEYRFFSPRRPLKDMVRSQ